MGRPGTLVAIFALAVGAAPASAAPLPAPGVAWVALHWEARKLLLSATTVIRCETQPGERLAPFLRAAPGGTGVLSPPWVVRLTIETDLPVGRDEVVWTWLDPASFAALQTEKRTFGKRPHVKVFRYIHGGYYEWRRAPANEAEARLPPEAWSALRESSALGAEALPEGAVVVDPYALLYAVSAAQLHRPGAHLSAWVLSRGRPLELSFHDGGLTRRPVDYLVQNKTEERRRHGETLVRLVKVGARGSPSAGRNEKIDLGFLGLEGELTIALDAETGIPVELNGRSRAVGPLLVRLNRVELATATASVQPTQGDS